MRRYRPTGRPLPAPSERRWYCGCGKAFNQLRRNCSVLASHALNISAPSVAENYTAAAADDGASMPPETRSILLPSYSKTAGGSACCATGRATTRKRSSCTVPATRLVASSARCCRPTTMRLMPTTCTSIRQLADLAACVGDETGDGAKARVARRWLIRQRTKRVDDREDQVLGWFQRLLPKSGDFFAMFERHSAACVEAAESLAELIEGRGDRDAHVAAIRDREHDADEIIREVLIE